MLKKKEIFSIPNILGYFRIILIPVFIALYLKANTTKEYFYAALVVGISCITDMFDGLIARKFNMITDLGKFIDPLADKLTQGSFIICLTFKHRLMLILIIMFFIKEGFMSVMGLYMLKKHKTKLDGAKWFGKVCTAFLDSVLFLLLLIPDLPSNISNILICICAVIMFLTFTLYLQVYIKMLKSTNITA